jgi:peptidoglycan/LPS O-acetylase OafA/YrhL
MNDAAADAMNPHEGPAYAARGASGAGASAPPVADAGVGRPTRAVLSAVMGRAHAEAAASRDASLDTLRAFVTVLVVAHHSVLAYALISPAAAPRSPVHPWLAGVPIVDSHRLAVFDLFALFNDTFFMSLMFLLSGLFVGPSLARKGGASFLRDRALRLGAPFVVLALMAPLAYYPAYRASAANPSALAFWREWLSLGIWPSGPLWFVAALLGFDVVAAALHRFAPRLFERAGRLASSGRERPMALFATLILVSAAAYLPPRAVFGPESWAAVGPISLQSSRALHYFVYFLAGVVIGDCESGHGLLALDGLLVRRWRWWTRGALALFALYVAMLVGLGPGGPANGLPPLARQLIFGVGFVLCCGAISFAMLAVFRRFANTGTPLRASLSRNAYGIYLLHYGFVLWLQYALLPAALPAAAKAAVVLAVALAASWTATAALRRIKVVARVI